MRKPERHRAVGLGWKGCYGSGNGIAGKESRLQGYEV